MCIRKFDPNYFEDIEGFHLVDVIYYHDTIIPRFVDDYIAKRDYLINLPGIKGRFGSEMMVILRKD